MSSVSPLTPSQVVLPEHLTQRTSAISLALHLYQGCFHVAVFDPSEGHFHWVKSFDVEKLHPSPFDDTVRFLLECKWVHEFFRTCTITFDTREFSMVPSGLIQAGKESDMLFLPDSGEKGQVDTCQLQESAITVVYRVPSAIKKLQQAIPGARLFPACALFLRYVTGHNDRHAAQIHALIEPGSLVLSVVVKGAHQLTNYFTVEGDEDILYYISHAAIRLGIDLESAQILFYGKQVTSSIESLLRTYCRDIRHWKLPESFVVSGDQDAEKNFSVIIHPICAS